MKWLEKIRRWFPDGKARRLERELVRLRADLNALEHRLGMPLSQSGAEGQREEAAKPRMRPARTWFQRRVQMQREAARDAGKRRREELRELRHTAMKASAESQQQL